VITLWGLNKKRLGDILLDAGLINNDQLSEVLAEQKISGKKIGEILIEKGYVTKKKITEALEQQLGIPYVNLVQNVPEADVIRLVPENIARRHEIIPVKLENNVLTVAAADPLNITAFDDVRIFTGYEIQPAIADSDAIENLLSRFYSTQKAAQAVEEFSKANELFARDMYNLRARMDELGNLNDSPAVRLINILFDQAIQNGASDIHIEPQGKYLRVRFRIDGQLQDIMRSDMDILPSLISRIKVMAGMNIAEKRLPQDGRISYKIGQDEVDLRISVLPTMHGEKAVVRLIGKNTFNIPKDQLGFLPENLAALESMLKSPHGIILVTGPTGSGKTTTLYTAVKELNKPEINIVTVEDPVESIIEGITQVQVNPKAGLDFATSLRSILRQDPDIILIGEIRDSETAEIAVRSAITGHLVLSTIHTNDAASSVIRLVDMGIQPFLVSTSLVGVIAQRLVRRICQNCRIEYEPDESEIEAFGGKVDKGVKFYRGTGCEVCRGTGYRGRIAIHEVMKVDPELRDAIYRGASSDVIKEIAIKNGMITLHENCRRIVFSGITTVEEMVRAVYLQE